MIYLIGSLRNPKIPNIADVIRTEGFEVFDDWFAAGPEADDKWREYEEGRGRSYTEALSGLAAEHVFSFDSEHLNRCEAGILVLPAGKSGHMELGYLLGRGKPGYILLEAADRWDVMYKFATLVTTELQEILEYEHERSRRKLHREPEEVGSKVPQVSTGSRELVEGPKHKNWCSYCDVGEECTFCWVQRVSPRNVR